MVCNVLHRTSSVLLINRVFQNFVSSKFAVEKFLSNESFAATFICVNVGIQILKVYEQFILTDLDANRSVTFTLERTKSLVCPSSPTAQA